MKDCSNTSYELERLYDNRFDAQTQYRNRVWSAMTDTFFSRYIPSDSMVLDLGCGHGEFINNIKCRKKFGMDLNPGVRRHLNSDVVFLEQDCTHPWDIADASFDVVFSSNFFEHLPSKQALNDTLAEAQRCIRPGGRLIAMGPNIRFVGGAYWDFWDHHLPLTELSLAELLRIRSFLVERAVDRFLPYTMVGMRPVPTLFVNWYLRMPLAWRFFGKQFLIIARKP